MSTESEAPLLPEIPEATEPVQALPSFLSFVHVGAAFAAAAAILYFIQSASLGIVDPDGYYHIRWSRLLWENLPHGRLPAFVWLPLTILNQAKYVDHHFLFHVFQIPFTWGSNLIAGAKASAVVYGALAIAACYALLLWTRVRYPIVWFLAVAGCSAPFLFRMSLPRAPAVTVATLALALWLLYTRRYVLYGVLTFFLVWMYSLFPLAGVLAVAWTIGVWIEERRFDWRPVVFCGVGMVAGLIVNPYFPQNIGLFIDHVKMKIGGDYEVAVGNEWYPYETWYLFVSSLVAWVAQVVGWLALRPASRKDGARAVCLFLFSTFLLVLTLKSRRFIEYWPPFAVLFAAAALEPYLARYTWSSLESAKTRWIAAAGALVVAGAILGSLVGNVMATRASVAEESDPTAYAGAARWLVENTPDRAMVFNTDWDDFPMLFYYDQRNVYASGLDPTYLLHADRELSKLYEDITLGHVDDPGPIILDRFGARYAFTDTGHTDFIAKATENGGMKIVYEDDHAAVLELVTDASAPETEK